VAGLALGAPATEVAGDTVNGHKMRNTGREWLHVRNTSGSPETVTLIIPRTVDGAAVEDPQRTIAANESRSFPPFNESVYDPGSGAEDVGYLTFDVSSANLRFQAFRKS
jgi:hypothetical protein